MSSFPQHEENVRHLESMGFDVSESLEGGGVSLESWGYDEQTYFFSEVISQLIKQNFKVSKDE